MRRLSSGGKIASAMVRMKRAWLLVAAVLCCAAAVLAAENGSVDEIAGYVRVNALVSTGAQPTMPQLLALGQADFRAVVNLREEQEFEAAAEAEAVRNAGLIYIRIPVRTSDPHDAEVDEFLRVTDDPSNYPIFIHCGSGNRVGAFWLIRRVLRDGRSFEDAEAEAIRIGLKSQNLKDFARRYIETHPAGSPEPKR